jgi:hypothetical protein
MTIKVICKLPNASTKINGVRFERVGEHVHSVDELTQEQLDHFASITGYEVVDSDAADAAQDDVEEASAPDEAAQPTRGPGRRPKGIKAAQ